MTSRACTSPKERVRAVVARAPFLAALPVIGRPLADLRDELVDDVARARHAERMRRLRNLKHVHERAPDKFVGGLLSNQLGLQPLRAAAHHALWRARGWWDADDETCDETVTALARDGVAILRGFVGAEALQLLRDEFDRLSPRMVSYFAQRRGLVARDSGGRLVPGTEQLVDAADDGRLDPIVARSTHHRIRARPLVELDHVVYPAGMARAAHGDGQDVLHCDVAYPSLKAFLYLDDVGADDCPFTYAPGTHRLTRARLASEHRHAVSYFRRRRSGEMHPAEVDARDRVALGIREVPQTAPAGSVVLFNAMGFHRRGSFTGRGGCRRAIILNYRALDAAVNRVPFLWRQRPAR